MGVKLNPTPLYGVHGDNDTVVKLRVDGGTDELITVDHDEQRIHSGRTFEVRTFTELSINEFLDVQIVIPDSKEWVNFVGGFTTENEANWWFYEGVSIVTPGTGITSYNCNRNLPQTTDVTVAWIINANVGAANADTAIAAATTLFSGVSGAGRETGTTRQESELVLKQNTAYSLRFEAVAAGYINYNFLWYGQAQKDKP